MIYSIEVLAIGTYTKIDFRDKSGCSDVDVDCWQEATFKVAAENLDDAVAMVYKDYERLNRDYTNTCDTLYYNPVPLSECEDDGDEPEILDYHFCEPKDGDGAKEGPRRYSKEVEI